MDSLSGFLGLIETRGHTDADRSSHKFFYPSVDIPTQRMEINKMLVVATLDTRKYLNQYQTLLVFFQILP